MSAPEDPVALVRRGYDAVSRRYRGDDDPTPPEYAAWLERLVALVPTRAHVLDLGCGNGIPVARDLVAAGLRVTGVDVSDVQIERARELVPTARFVRVDVVEASWPAHTFDAVVAAYSIIHVPSERQRELIARLARWTKPDGWLLLVAGSRAWTGTEDDWLGGGATMWWSHPDADTYRRWLTETGWAVADEQFVPEGDSGHQVFWARRSTPAGVTAEVERGDQEEHREDEQPEQALDDRPEHAGDDGQDDEQDDQQHV